MARLLTWPDFGNAGIVKVTPVNGPSARNSGSNTAADGSEQTFSGIGDRWAFTFDLVSQRGADARRTRGLLNSGLASGVNATRWTVVDPDRMSLMEAGLSGNSSSVEWANGAPWSNGRKWGISYPVVAVAETAAADDRIVWLADSFWGHSLGIGDWFGFFPFSLGLYEVSEVIEPGRYRIWPPLRTALTAGTHYATLTPTLALRLTGPGATRLSRGLTHTEGQGADLVEVVDAHVRAYFAD